MKRKFFVILVGIVIFSSILFPSLNVSVSASQRIQTAGVGGVPGFKDVGFDYIFYDEVGFLASKGHISGFDDGSFRADNVVTRAQAAIMIGRALGLNGDSRDTNFSDVTADITGSGYIASAVEKGIISGFNDGTFHPYEAVTRGQMSIFLNRAYTLPTGQTNSFTDVSSNMTAYQSILNVAASGITGGYSDGTYRPDQQVNRGQFSAFLARTLEPTFRKSVPQNPSLPNEAVQIHNEYLENTIRNTLKKQDDMITVADMYSLNEITVFGSEFSYADDITGIEYAKNLSSLALTLNRISDIQALSGLTKLNLLDLEANLISDISALKGLTDLEVLYLNSNNISDISALKGLTKLKNLGLSFNQISDISALSGLTNLQSLDLAENPISDISSLINLTNLKFVRLEESKLNAESKIII